MKVCGSIGDGEEPHDECADALQMVQVKSSVGNDPTEKMNMLIIPLHCLYYELFIHFANRVLDFKILMCMS